MIQFPSDANRDGQGHIAGSQKAADELIARNCKRAAHRQAKRQRGITVVLTGAMLELIVIACMGAMIVAGVLAASGMVHP